MRVGELIPGDPLFGIRQMSGLGGFGGPLDAAVLPYRVRAQTQRMIDPTMMRTAQSVLEGKSVVDTYVTDREGNAPVEKADATPTLLKVGALVAGAIVGLAIAKAAFR